MSDTTSDDGSLVVIDDREKLVELLGRFLDEDDVRELLGDEEALRAVLGRFVTSTGSDGGVTVSELLALAEEFPEPIWEPDRATLLESLIAVADQPTWKRRLVTGSPWQSGYELTLSTIGSLHNLERRRVMVFPDEYHNYRKGNLDVDVSGRCEIGVDGDMRVSIGPVDTGTDGGSALANPGVDELTVNGDVDVRFQEKTTLISGAINRVWTGPVTRLAGMEGVICGGIFARVHAGPCMTVAAVVSGDVYGGAARASGARVYVAGMHYRAAQATHWLMPGAYVRTAGVVLEPLVGSPSGNTPAKSLAAKAAKLSVALCPFLEIGIGVATLPIGVVRMIAGLVRKRPPKPVGGLPRTRTRLVAGVEVSSANSVIDT